MADDVVAELPVYLTQELAEELCVIAYGAVSRMLRMM